MRVTAGLALTLPLITYGGAVRFDPVQRSIDSVEALPPATVEAITAATGTHPRVEPVLFAMVDGRDRVCWRAGHETDHLASFVARREGDPRLYPIPDWRHLADLPVFYATLIGDRDDIDALRHELEPELTDCFDTVGADGYNIHQTWFEVMSVRATKAAAAQALAHQVHAERVIAFGDNLNDVPLFEVAVHAVAVANAVPELLRIAHEVVSSNDDEAIADWLEQHVLSGQTSS